MMQETAITAINHRTLEGNDYLKIVFLFLLTMIFLSLTANQSLAQDSLLQREDVIADIRQLANIIENTHPDPYSAGGGRITFHRRLHETLNAVPETGMTTTELIRLLRPFVASIGDQHTSIYSVYHADPSKLGGVPFVFDIVEKDLFVIAAFQEEDSTYVGARLISVEGVGTDELIRRFSELEGVENEYFALRQLGQHNLLFGSYSKELIPEWEDTTKITFQFRLTAGKIENLVRSTQIGLSSTTLRHLGKSHIDLPKTDSSYFLFQFIDPFESGEEIGYLRVDYMGEYREAHEMAVSRGKENYTPDQLARFPSATETFRNMVIEMKQKGTDVLIVDIRNNGGGNFIMGPILVYFLYGKQKLTEMHVGAESNGGGHGDRYCALYFESNPNESLDEINQGRSVPLVMGDIDFSRILGDTARYDSSGKLIDNPVRLKHYQRATTFYREYESEEYSGYYCPKHVLVLMTPFTSSSGLDMTLDLYFAGATLVGTPSAQAPNSWGNLFTWKLAHSGIEGEVSSSFDIVFPDDPERGRVLPVNYPMSYEKLASFGFDPDAIFLYAMEILAELRD
ncbi:MAG: S41 family peptidase [candidate division Zixibacteria bacterium]|nr:S41 family peptidase [candidate division Zixibacteria bacterium]